REEETAMSSSNITVYSTTWCPDCHRAKSFLKSQGVEYREVDIEKTPEAADVVAEHNNGKHIVPTFEIAGSYYGNPSLAELGELISAA
ncbi:MAG: glutaredoxin family protein, partial [Acidobacteriota bacterium]